MKDFIFGNGITKPQYMSSWNPDSIECTNPHMVISGESGSGKSTLLRNIIKHLAENNKHIYVMDLHGDLSIQNETLENTIEFKARKSSHGINPFEFDTTNTDNGGVMVNISSMVAMIKKAFLPSMGVKQETVLRQLIMDSYKIKGITDEDESSWNRQLPSMETMVELIDNLLAYHSSTGASISEQVQKLDAQRRKLKELDYAGYFKEIASSSMLNTDAIESMVSQKIKEEKKENLYGLFDRDELEKNMEIETFSENIESLYEGYGEEHAKRIVSTFKAILKASEQLQFLATRYRKYCLYGSYSDMFGSSLPEEINPSDYESKDVIKTLETLKSYIGSISISGIFTDTKPPIKPGLNRLDISGLPGELKSFFVDTFITKIFRAVSLRGDYKRRGNFSRGENVDTYIVVDEGRTILPSGKDKEDHEQIINKVMNEARKFGLGLIFVSQTPTHYSAALLSAYTKVVLKTQENEIQKSMKLLGVKDRNLYRIIEARMAALIGVGSRFEAVGLLGYKRPTQKTPLHESTNTVNSTPLAKGNGRPVMKLAV